MRVWAFPSFYPYNIPGHKWKGIFAHRQFKGMIENGAELKVVQPVKWFPPHPFSNWSLDWKYGKLMNHPYSRDYDGITVYHPKIANMKPSRLYRKSFEEKYIDAIVNFFKKEKIHLSKETDIFYSQWIPDAGLVQQVAKKMGIRSAVLIIGDDVNVWPHKTKEKMEFFVKTWKEADIRISVAKYLGNEANKLCGESLAFHVVYRGVDTEKFFPIAQEQKIKLKSELNIPEGKVIILTAATAVVAKGWIDLLDALAKVKENNSNFLLVAIHSGDPTVNLTEEVAKRNLTHEFLNMREVEPRLMNQYFNIADIFCLPSHWEGIANVVVEAMSCGLPVITTNVCGHPELVRSRDVGILVPPKQPDILCNELTYLINNPEKRIEMGLNARNYIVNEWGTFTQNSGKLYKILSSKTA